MNQYAVNGERRSFRISIDNQPAEQWEPCARIKICEMVDVAELAKVKEAAQQRTRNESKAM